MLPFRRLDRQNQFQLPLIALPDNVPVLLERPRKSLPAMEPLVSPPPTHRLTQMPQIADIILTQCPGSFLLCLSNKHFFFGSKQVIIVINRQQAAVQAKFDLTQTPTCIQANQEALFVGFSNGRISCYCIGKMALLGSCEEFPCPLTRIECIRGLQIIGCDQSGNLQALQFSLRTISDKFSKLFVSCQEVKIAYRNRKRQKIKKLFKSFLSRETEPEAEEPVPNNSATFTMLTESIRLQKGLQDILVIAYGDKSGIKMLTCNNELKTLDEHELSSQSPSLMLLGLGGLQFSNSNDILFVCGFASQVTIYRGVRIENSFDWLPISSISTQGHILDGGFLNNSLLLLMTPNTVEMCHVSGQKKVIMQFEPKQQQETKDIINQSKESESKLPLDKLQASQSILQSSIQSPNGSQKLFPKFIGFENYNFWFWTQLKAVKGLLLDWKAYLDQLIAQLDWNTAMRLAFDVYELRVSLLAHVEVSSHERYRQMKIYFQKIALAYLAQQIIRNPKNAKKSIQEATIFLIRTNCCDVLTTTIMEASRKLGCEAPFMQIICQYACDGLINYLPEALLSQLVGKQVKESRMHNAQTILSSIDLSVGGYENVLTVCLTHQVHRAIIGICAERKDFVTPIMKLCAQANTVDIQPEERDCIARLIFSYLFLCVEGRFTTYSNDQAYLAMLKQVVELLFIPDCLEILMLTSGTQMMSFLSTLLGPKVMRFLLENEDYFVIRGDSFIDIPFEESAVSEFGVYNRILANLLHIGSRLPETSQELIAWFIVYAILKNQYPFKTSLRVEALLYFVKNPNKFHSNKAQVNAYAIRILQTIRRQESAPKGILLAILEEVKLHSQIFNEFQCHLRHHLEDYAGTLRTILSADHKQAQSFIFDYLDFYLPQIESLCDSVLPYLPLLALLDATKTQKVLERITMETDYEQVIEGLKDFPQLQLLYLEKTFKHCKPLPSLLSLHLQLVAKHKPDELPSYIMKMDYSLEEANSLCEKVKDRVALAYVLIKWGRPLDGLTQLIDQMLSMCDNLFREVARKRIPPKEHSQTINRLLGEILKICHNTYEEDQLKGENLWQATFQVIFKRLRISFVEGPTVPAEIKTVVETVVSRLLFVLFEQVGFDFFQQRFCKCLDFLSPRTVVKAYFTLKAKLVFVHYVHSKTSDLHSESALKHRKQFNEDTRRGLISSGKCSVCCLQEAIPNRVYWGNSTVCVSCIQKRTSCLDTYRSHLQIDIMKALRLPEETSSTLRRVERNQEILSARTQKMRNFDMNQSLPMPYQEQ